MPTELFEDFFKALSDNLGANIHINLRYGRNEHHMAEAIFKAFARALRLAVEKDSRIKDLSLQPKEYYENSDNRLWSRESEKHRKRSEKTWTGIQNHKKPEELRDFAKVILPGGRSRKKRHG